MVDQASTTATRLLTSSVSGDASATKELFELLYNELRSIAAANLARERPNHSWQPTDLLGELFLRLIDQTRTEWKSELHFKAVAATVMRRILVDHWKSKNTTKRGGGRIRMPLDENVGASPDMPADYAELDIALEELSRRNPRWAKVIELRFFGGLTVAEVAAHLAMGDRQVEDDYRFARAWLQSRLSR